MSVRARFETVNGEYLTLSRGTLRVRSSDGETQTHQLSSAQKVELSPTSLTVSIIAGTPGSPEVIPTVFVLKKNAEQIHREMRSAFVEKEKARLVNLTRSLSQAPRNTDLENPGNPAYDAALKNLTAFCDRYGLNLLQTLGMGGKATSNPSSSETTSETPASAPAAKPRKKAKERRAEAAATKE